MIIVTGQPATVQVPGRERRCPRSKARTPQGTASTAAAPNRDCPSALNDLRRGLARRPWSDFQCILVAVPFAPIRRLSNIGSVLRAHAKQRLLQRCIAIGVLRRTDRTEELRDASAGRVHRGAFSHRRRHRPIGSLLRKSLRRSHSEQRRQRGCAWICPDRQHVAHRQRRGRADPRQAIGNAQRPR